MHLAISHHLFLTREEIYSLYEGNDLEVIGISIPVWFKNNITSEPANEVFVKYKLFNQDKPAAIRIRKNYYEITMPKKSHLLSSLSEEESFRLSQEKPFQLKNDVNGGAHVGLKSLLDTKDGGCNWISFKQIVKVQFGKDKHQVKIIHYVEIKHIKELLKTLT